VAKGLLIIKEIEKFYCLNVCLCYSSSQFVAHPYSQLMLNAVLYQDFDQKWSHRSSHYQTGVCSTLHDIFPVVVHCVPSDTTQQTLPEIRHAAG